jgi:hypothetical protein
MTAEIPPHSSDGGAPPARASRSRAFRHHQAEQRGVRRERVGQVLAIAVLILAVYVIVTARPQGTASTYTFPSPGPTITVQFGAPSGSGVNCSGGGTAFAERIPWLSTTQPVTTGDVNLRLYEIWDGDYLTDSGAVATASPTSACAGGAPTSLYEWYVVLVGSNGTNELTYTDAGWASITGSSWNFEIPNGSTLILVTYTSLVDSGRGLAVTGFAGGSPIKGSLVL